MQNDNEKVISGKAFVAGDNIDTDQIIPAEFLSYNPADPEERKYFGMYAMCGIPISQAGLPQGNTPFVAEGQYSSEFAVIIGGSNFGCGSSREQASECLLHSGIKAIVACSFARIFYRNSINLGLPVIECPEAVAAISTGDGVHVELAKGVVRVGELEFAFAAYPPFVLDLIEDGGLIEHIRKNRKEPSS